MKKIVLILLVVTVCSCDYFKPNQKPQSIARVQDNFLYKSDVATLVPAGTSKKDSLLMVQDYIDRWATQKLLMEAAEKNISNKKKSEYNELIKQYQIDLYTKAYLEELVKTSVDTVVSSNELIAYYNKNKENFKANGPLVRLRYLNFSKDNPKYALIRSNFFNNSKKNASFWKANETHFKSFALNDSVWVDMGQIYDKLPFITPENRDELVFAGKKIEKVFQDDVFLVAITNVVQSGQVCPFEYIAPTLKELIINRRELELIKNFEKDIKKDALKNKDYEIYQ